MELDKAQLTKEIINARKVYGSEVGYYTFLEAGGMALADHKGETLRQYLKACNALDTLHYFERLAGVQETSNEMPVSKYVKEKVS